MNYLTAHIPDPELTDLLFRSRLVTSGIVDASTYLANWRWRIVFCVVICAGLGAVNWGFTGLLVGALAGVYMPLVLLHVWIALIRTLAYVFGYLLGLALMVFGLWALFYLLFAY